MKILFLSHHWTHNTHWSLHSGIKRIINFAAETNDVTVVTWGAANKEYMEDNVHVITVKGSGKDYLFLKRMAISRKGAAIAKDYDAIHSVVSDCTYYLPYKGFTMTLHVLPAVVHYKELKQNLFLFMKYHIIQKRAFRRAKEIACVSTNLMEAIPAKYRDKAHFIPHGIDTDFWNPTLAKAHRGFSEGGYILCVGAHGLDRDSLAQFIVTNPALPFVFVGIKEKLGDFPNTHYLTKVSDEDLRDLYFGCALMFRPLRFATANNSLLEALSMGKTILASRIPGVTDYLSDDTCVFIDTLKDRSIANMNTLRLDPAVLRQVAIQKFGWRKVLDTYIALYNR
jgi:glycosyltransferase involved in cell wall biosynthesis